MPESPPDRVVTADTAGVSKDTAVADSRVTAGAAALAQAQALARPATAPATLRAYKADWAHWPGARRPASCRCPPRPQPRLSRQPGREPRADDDPPAALRHRQDAPLQRPAVEPRAPRHPGTAARPVARLAAGAGDAIGTRPERSRNSHVARCALGHPMPAPLRGAARATGAALAGRACGDRLRVLHRRRDAAGGDERARVKLARAALPAAAGAARLRG